MYVYRIKLWHNSGDFGDTGDNVQTMQYVFFQSDYAGGKGRGYQIFNSSSAATLSYSGPNQVIYTCQPSITGGSGAKYCVIENIGNY